MEQNRERRKFYINTPLKAAKSLQEQLPVDEMSYHSIHGTSFADARAYLVYGVLNEVLKMSTAMIRWNILFSEPIEKIEEEVKDEQFRFLALEAVIDEQQLWLRKLTEILINLICFSETNTQDHYRAFLAAERLRDYLGLQYDFEHFYHCRSANLNQSIEYWLAILDKLGKNINLSDSWFIHDNLDKDTWPGRVSRSIGSRFREAIQIASDQEKIVLGLSYADGISSASRSLHPQIGGIRYSATFKDVERNIAHLSMMSLHIIFRSHNLAGIELTGISKEIERIINEESIAPEIMGKRLELGDLVIAYSDLAEVIEVRESEYGYASYKVRYLSRPPIPGVDDEDWFPQRYVHLFVKKGETREFFRKNLEQYPEFREKLEILMQLSEEELYQVMRRFFTDIADKGLLGAFLFG